MIGTPAAADFGTRPPVRPFSCHGPTGTITMLALALKLRGPNRVRRDLEDDHEPVALVPLFADAGESEARDVGQGGIVVGLDRARTVLTAGSAAALTSSALSMARAQPWRRYPGTTVKPTSTMPASSGGRWNPASPTTAPSGSGHHGPRDPGRGGRVLGDLAGAIAEDPAGPLTDEVFVEGDPGLGAATGKVATGKRPQRLRAQFD